MTLDNFLYDFGIDFDIFYLHKHSMTLKMKV